MMLRFAQSKLLLRAAAPRQLARAPAPLPCTLYRLFSSQRGGDGGDSGNGSGGGDLVQIGSESSNALSRIGIGENAPKPPHLLAVPIQRRPLFPGEISPLATCAVVT